MQATHSGTSNAASLGLFTPHSNVGRVQALYAIRGKLVEVPVGGYDPGFVAQHAEDYRRVQKVAGGQTVARTPRVTIGQLASPKRVFREYRFDGAGHQGGEVEHGVLAFGPTSERQVAMKHLLERLCVGEE